MYLWVTKKKRRELSFSSHFLRGGGICFNIVNLLLFLYPFSVMRKWKEIHFYKQSFLFYINENYPFLKSICIAILAF